MRSRGSIRRRGAAGLAALVAATGLAIVDPLGPTRPADAAIDPITGFGDTDSAVTVKWADGVVRSDNRTIAAPREQSGSDAFYEDLRAKYGDLAVTVSQTEELAHQGVQITWTGGVPTDTSPGGLVGDYLQIMQCYGDAPTGPDPEACQWGSFGRTSLPAGPGDSKLQNRRTGSVCPGASGGCDPAEPSGPDHQWSGHETEFNVPFTPVGKPELKIYLDTVDPADPTAETLRTYFQAQSTNEVPVAATSADGSGRVSFEVQTGREANGLGCGDPNTAAGGAPRGCWLVIVPRGSLAPDGTSQGPGPGRLGVFQTALSASNWAQRLQVHLGFLPTSNICPQGAAQRAMVGTELVTNLATSWQPALCQDGGAVYTFTATPDAANAVQLASTLPGSAGLAFTTKPVAFADQGPPLIYAPVAVTGLTLAFQIDVTDGSQTQQVQRIRISPELMAKSLTQSYKTDLPGGVVSGTDFVQPEWMRTVRTTMLDDPRWQLLNPDVSSLASANITLAPMTTADQSAVNQSVWTWVQSEPDVQAWLRGQPDAGGMVVNPNYQALKLGDSPPASGYPRADPICTHITSGNPLPPGEACITSVDYIPYAHDLEDAAVHVQRANTHGTAGWDPTAVAPDGSTGWWAKPAPRPLGQRFSWTITSAAVSARYGLPTADLCSSGGDGCVVPSAASLTAAVAAAKPDSLGLLHVDPAAPGPGGYPLTQIVYAAVRTNQDPAALRDTAALLEYAAGTGQTSGVEVGQLPAGYLPLPNSLRDKTRAAAQTLRELAAARPTPTPSPTSTGGDDSGDPDDGAGVPSAGAPPATASPSALPPGGTVSQPPAGLAAGSTPNDALGAIRWLLVAALIAGAVGSLGGVVLRHPPTSLTWLFRHLFTTARTRGKGR
ncbi:type 2 periplasmic-binding domain-containing protein [Phytohabitans suffuscus]|uniref:PBP domain-containing protein n=1 Tax=Phytohabitans suffuscus TaxID=624315 RepID=A0A6F8YF27_9ACTN|nr:hypothetical protein [Phytohabitans suffuscus]BCB84706.1 hypothetical protein Psuf_020190 [Phytohabitans suffuscus]